MNEPLVPQLEYMFTITARIGSSTEVRMTPDGIRFVVPIIGGAFEGPAIRGRVLPGGADSQVVRGDLTLVEASFVLETSDNVEIGVRSRGIRYGPNESVRRRGESESVDRNGSNFRTIACFEPQALLYSWLKRAVFVGAAERDSERAVLRVWRVQ